MGTSGNAGADFENRVSILKALITFTLWAARRDKKLCTHKCNRTFLRDCFIIIIKLPSKRFESILFRAIYIEELENRIHLS